MENKPESIKLKFDTIMVPSKKFLQGIEAFLILLEEITGDVFKSKRAIPWSIKVEPGSNIIAAIPESVDPFKADPAIVSRVCSNGLRIMEQEAKRPEHFTEKAIEKARELAELSDPQRMRVSILFTTHEQEISSKIKANVDELLKWTYSDIGTIEGQLRILAQRQRLEIEIRDEISGRLIHCLIPENMLEDAKEAFLRRVAISGVIHYRSDGTPINIEVSQLYRFPLNRELPHHKDIRGIFGDNN